jgi:hypothetical protein
MSYIVISSEVGMIASMMSYFVISSEVEDRVEKSFHYLVITI